MIPTARPLRELTKQWAQSRAERLARLETYRSNAKHERNKEIIWLYDLGVPVNHIASLHRISETRVRAIIRARGTPL